MFFTDALLMEILDYKQKHNKDDLQFKKKRQVEFQGLVIEYTSRYQHKKLHHWNQWMKENNDIQIPLSCVVLL